VIIIPPNQLVNGVYHIKNILSTKKIINIYVDIYFYSGITNILLLLIDEVNMTEYKKFQEWLDICPVKIKDYDDYTDSIQVLFEIQLEDEIHNLNEN